MNRNLQAAIFDLAKVESLMFAIEETYLDRFVTEDNYEDLDRAAHAFYALWDEIKNVAKDLEKIEEDEILGNASRFDGRA